MVRAVSLTLPESTSWVDYGRPHMAAKLGAGFEYATLIRIQLLALILELAVKEEPANGRRIRG